MSFNLQKYLSENHLTLVSKIRINEEEESTKEKTDTENKGSDKDKQELAQLQAKAKDIIFKYTIDTPQGRKVKGSISDYKRAIGDIPRKIQNLKKKLGITTKEED
jgi:hypothetical protein